MGKLVVRSGDKLFVGADAALGTEIMRVTGGVWLLDGTVGPVPTSGAGTRAFFGNAKQAFRAGSVTATAWDDAAVGTGSAAFGIDPASGGYCSFAIGATVNASAIYSGAIGNNSYATVRGQFARANGGFAAAGDAQRSDVSLFRTSTDATTVELTTDGAAPGAGNRLTVLAGKSYRFRIELDCICTAGTNVGAVASWEIKGAIKNIGGTTSLVGALVVDATSVDAALALAVAALSADDANDSLKLECTGIVGVAANTFHWHAAVYLSEVG